VITETIRFERVPLTAAKTVQCAGCGKRLRRQRTFEMTLNPWNKNAQGQPRTRREILAALDAKAGEWKQQPEACVACRETGAPS
jgi:hypothetical protein